MARKSRPSERQREEQEMSPAEREKEDRRNKTVTVTVAANDTIIDGVMHAQGDEVELTYGDIAQYRRAGLCLTLDSEDEKELKKNV